MPDYSYDILYIRHYRKRVCSVKGTDGDRFIFYCQLNYYNPSFNFATVRCLTVLLESTLYMLKILPL